MIAPGWRDASDAIGRARTRAVHGVIPEPDVPGWWPWACTGWGLLLAALAAVGQTGLVLLIAVCGGWVAVMRRINNNDNKETP